MQAQLGVGRRGRVRHGLGIAACSQPRCHRQVFERAGHRGVAMQWMLQTQQSGGRSVEPQDALLIAIHHHDRIGQNVGGGAIGAQHSQQA